MGEAQVLSDAQAKALLDILSHHEVYQEILDFRLPGTLSSYGPPFESRAGSPSTSPSLQALVSKFSLTLPGLGSVAKDFWRTQLATIIEDLEKVELSESYDKGHLGIRKTLATAISALIEYPVRGVYAGFDRPDEDASDRQYDTKDAAELQKAFKDGLQQAVYGTFLDEVFAMTAETDKLAEHTPRVQAAHEYVIVNLASFMHFTLIKSPKGQQLLTLIDHANKMVPYTIIRQTLRIGNVASMINAMVKVVLAKMSVASVTNWMGLTQASDDGMNLMQNIIAQVLQWEIRDFKSRATKTEKSKHGPSKEQLRALKQYIDKSRDEHEEIRRMSIDQSKSIATVILHHSGTAPTMSDQAHAQALDYLALQLSIRDRVEIVRVLCRSHPDHLTALVRDLVSAYEPIIRHVHNAVDLSATVYDFEVFLRDTIRLAKLPDPNARSAKSQQQSAQQPPTVGDFVQLLKKHQSSSHRFLHQAAKNDKELTGWFFEYAKTAATNFQQQDPQVADQPPKGAGDLTGPLQDLFSALPATKQKQLLPILDRQSAYLNSLHAASAARLRDVIASPASHPPALNASSNSANNTRPSTPTMATSKNTSRAPSPTNTSSTGPSRTGSARRKFQHHKESTTQTQTQTQTQTPTANPGPGAYLARWQSLLDGTLLTPREAEGGSVRGGNGASAGVKAPAITPLTSASTEQAAQPQATRERDATEDTNHARKEAGTEQTHTHTPTTTPNPNPNLKPFTANPSSNSNDHSDESDNDSDIFEEALENLSLNEMEVVPNNKDSPTTSSSSSDDKDNEKVVAKPDVSPVVEALGKGYREMLGRRGCWW